MNHKEELKEVKDQLINAGDYEDMDWDCGPKAILEALEKQIPKTPIVIDKWHMCPTCYEKYGFSYDILVGTKGCKSGEVHCHNCGQLINMEVKE